MSGVADRYVKNEKSEKGLIRTDEATVLLLDRMVSEITSLRKQGNETLELVKKQIPFGAVEPLSLKTATTTPSNIRFNHPFFSINIVNNGPNDCWIIVNTGKSFTTSFLLQVGSVEEIDMKTAQIEDIRYYTDAGTAVLRIRGVR